MRKTLRQFKARALARPEVKREYERLAGEFEFLDEILKARTAAGLTQADVAARIGTLGFTVTGLGPAEFAAIVQKDTARWREIIKVRRIKAE